MAEEQLHDFNTDTESADMSERKRTKGSTIKSKLRPPKCSKCEKVGLLSRDCWKNQFKIEPKTTATVAECNAAITATSNLVIDSGATEPMVNTNEHFIHYRSFNKPRKVLFGSRFREALGSGDIVAAAVIITIWIQATYATVH